MLVRVVWLDELRVSVAVFIVLLNKEVLDQVGATLVLLVVEGVLISYLSKRMTRFVFVYLELVDWLSWVSHHLLVHPTVDAVLVAQDR
jgi:hypothetical protein